MPWLTDRSGSSAHIFLSGFSLVRAFVAGTASCAELVMRLLYTFGTIVLLQVYYFKYYFKYYFLSINPHKKPIQNFGPTPYWSKFRGSISGRKTGRPRSCIDGLHGVVMVVEQSQPGLVATVASGEHAVMSPHQPLRAAEYGMKTSIYMK